MKAVWHRTQTEGIPFLSLENLPAWSIGTRTWVLRRRLYQNKIRLGRTPLWPRAPWSWRCESRQLSAAPALDPSTGSRAADHPAPRRALARRRAFSALGCALFRACSLVQKMEALLRGPWRCSTLGSSSASPRTRTHFNVHPSEGLLRFQSLWRGCLRGSGTTIRMKTASRPQGQLGRQLPESSEDCLSAPAGRGPG